MSVHFNPTSSSHSLDGLQDNELSLLIPIACATIAAVGLYGTIARCFGKRVLTQREVAPEPKNKTTEEPPRQQPTPVIEEPPAPVSKEKARQKRSEKNRIWNEKRRAKKKNNSSASESSEMLAHSSSEQSSSENASSSSTPTPKKPVLPDQFVFTSPSASSSSSETSPREPEAIYVTERYIAMNIPQDQFNAFYREAQDLLGNRKPFHRSINPHITIADAEDTRYLKPQDRKEIQEHFNRLIQNREVIPLKLKTVLHQAGPHQPLEEFLVLDVAVSPQLDCFRMSLLIDGYIRPDASMQHQGRGFHITLGRRYIDDQSQQDLQKRLREGNLVLSTVNWPGARL